VFREADVAVITARALLGVGHLDGCRGDVHDVELLGVA
jgi:hypothetical protein